MAKKIIIPGRLHAGTTEQIVTGSNEVFDDKRNKTQEAVNDELYETQEVANKAAAKSKYYNELTQKAIEGMSVTEQEVLKYSQDVVKHGRAIEKIAEQLGSTYNNDGREEDDEYNGGIKFKPIEEDDMEIILGAGTTDDDTVYLVLEPKTEDTV